jgi:hypothetical protein
LIGTVTDANLPCPYLHDDDGVIGRSKAREAEGGAACVDDEDIGVQLPVIVGI